MSSFHTPPPPLPPLPSFPSHSSSKISPIVLLVIVILAIIFFVSGILHLLVRFLIKRPSFYSSVTQSNRYSNNSNNSDPLQRQLQQLFRLHDSGLDQALIDSLPVFYYKDITGLKQPFDCAVCLCEFSNLDKLRLLPVCSHAFHVSCIDTWLLSNSTCPLCRGSLLISSGLENQEFSLEYWRELSFGCSVDGIERDASNVVDKRPTIMEENASESRVFSVRLGKFRSLNDGEETSTSSSSQLDARRCYSLGSCQYVVNDSDLHVALSRDIVIRGGTSARGMKVEKMVGGQCVGFSTLVVDEDVEGKKISRRNRGDSFSVSKIWLWSKKTKFPSSSETVNVRDGGDGGDGSVNAVLPLSSRDRVQVLG